MSKTPTNPEASNDELQKMVFYTCPPIHCPSCSSFIRPFCQYDFVAIYDDISTTQPTCTQLIFRNDIIDCIKSLHLDVNQYISTMCWVWTSLVHEHKAIKPIYNIFMKVEENSCIFSARVSNESEIIYTNQMYTKMIWQQIIILAEL